MSVPEAKQGLDARGFEVALADGTAARLRPLQPDDKACLAWGMEQLSAESRYHRFFTSAPQLSQEQLRYLTEIDQRRHVAWLAVRPGTTDHTGMGVGRYVCLRNAPDIAEVALTVLDEHQGTGLGTWLLATLHVCALKSDVRVLRAMVLPENRRVIEWLMRLGAKSHYIDGMVEMDLDAMNWRASPGLREKVEYVMGKPMGD
ncbi:MAG: GNAT family N-acetyltransferase [Verrucomicrobiota bacterium]